MIVNDFKQRKDFFVMTGNFHYLRRSRIAQFRQNSISRKK